MIRSRAVIGGRTILPLILLILPAGAFESAPSSLESAIKAEIQERRLCAKLDFDSITVNSKDGVTEVTRDSPDRIRAGDLLLVDDVEVSNKGMDVEIDFQSDHTRGESVEAEISLYRSIRGPRNEFINRDELWSALDAFTEPCSSARKEEKSP